MRRRGPVHKSRLLAYVITAGGFLLVYLPLAVLTVYSFRKGSSVIGGRGYWTVEPYLNLLKDSSLLEALGTSLWIGTWNTMIAAVLGTLAALALERARIPGRRWVELLIVLPLVTPEIVLGLTTLMWFVFLRLTLGTFSIILAHVTFSLSYVIVTVRTRLQGLDPSLDEAARDLGATAWQTFWRVTFPLVLPGVISGALLAFTLSFDDFLITFFTAGPGSETLPIKLYSMIRFGVSAEINALSTLIFFVTVALVLLFSRKAEFAARH